MKHVIEKFIKIGTILDYIEVFPLNYVTNGISCANALKILEKAKF